MSENWKQLDAVEVQDGGSAFGGHKQALWIARLERELERENARQQSARRMAATLYLLLTVSAIAVLTAMLAIPVFRINGSSMTDTLQDGDIVIAFKQSKPDTGDVIAFYYNNSILVKRVIATEGDWVDIDDDGTVFVNGIRLDEPYLSEKAKGNCNIELPYQVPQDRLFLMGDHRETSLDSRNSSLGCIDRSLVIGKILFRIWPIRDLSVVE